MQAQNDLFQPLLYEGVGLNPPAASNDYWDEKMNVTTETQRLSEKLTNQLAGVEVINRKISEVSWGMRVLLEKLESAHVNITHLLNTDHLNLSASLRSSLGEFLEDAHSLKSLVNSSALFHSVCQEPDRQEEPKEGQNIPCSVSTQDSSLSSEKQDDAEQHHHQDSKQHF